MKKKSKEPVKVEAGEVVTYKTGHRIRTLTHVEHETRELTVQPKGDGCKEGNWVCAEHGEAIPNQFMKDVHVQRGSCRLAWYCSEHDQLEVP